VRSGRGKTLGTRRARNQRLPFYWFLVLALLIACIYHSKSSALAATVEVRENILYQRIEGIGGNYAFSQSGSSVGQYTLTNLNPRHARVEMDLTEWEPNNDDGNPSGFNWSAFQDRGKTNTNFLQLQDFRNRGIPAVASIWNVPHWMVQNPEAENDRVVPQSMYDEAIESIAAYLIHARDRYGVTIPYISFNEVEIGWRVVFSSSDMADFIKKAGARFAELGLSVKWLTGDVGHADALVDYALPILQDADARQHLGPISVHTWYPEYYGSDTVYRDIYDLAKQYGLPVWVEEVGIDPEGWNIPGYTTGWDYAFDLARLYYRLIKFMGASVMDYWEYGNDYPLVNSSSLTPYPAFYVVKQIAEHLPPGTDIVEATSDNPNILVISGKNDATGNFMVQVINDGSSPETVTFLSLPNSNLSLQRTSDGENMINAGNHTPSNGTLTLTLPARSISTLSGPDTNPVKKPSPPAGLVIR
jgi:O-glycosyl hydrolase